LASSSVVPDFSAIVTTMHAQWFRKKQRKTYSVLKAIRAAGFDFVGFERTVRRTRY